MASAARALLVARSRALLGTLQSVHGNSSSSLTKARFGFGRHGTSNVCFQQHSCSISLLASIQIDDEKVEHPSSLSLSQHNQIRWKRKGGASAFKPRPVSRKKLKQYNRRKKKQHFEKYGKHSAPGSKAGPRRQYLEEEWNDLLNHSPIEEPDPSLLEYTVHDAMVDDLMGNTAHLTSTPTPEPVYLGHKHRTYYQRVSEQIQQYKQQQLALSAEGEETESNKALSTNLSLPSDKDISLVLRAYRDRHGTRTKPIGIAKALQHLLQDLSIPTSAFGELTYTTLLTCCRTPKEARRILKLQKDQQHEISAYSWSILVDIYSKMGDYEGANQVLDEMATHGVAPTLPAYTSLLAACYKVVNAGGGRIPSHIRNDAFQVAWRRWKEMRIVGVDADVMAYGAMLRLVAARGQAERALGLLEEMQTFQVKPTTLCFTSALKAVARSHATAVRYERASSKKQKRRELVTAHHGKLTRSIVILAENAQVEQDDGFVAALMQCAAAAGDSATAKAILLASHIRRMDHLRTIGSNQHLSRLAGGGGGGGGAVEEEESMLTLTDGTQQEGNGIANQQQQHTHRRRLSFADREYGGNDTRTLSALLLSCSTAAENGGLGDMWAGRENLGYLCDNSLRLLPMRPTPKYDEQRVPGMSHAEVARTAMVWDEEEPEEMSKRLRRKKFQGVDIDEDAGFTLDEMDEQIQTMFAKNDDDESDEENTVKKFLLGEEGQEDVFGNMPDGTSTAYYDAETGTYHVDDGDVEETTLIEDAAVMDDQENEEPQEEWYFDANARKWKTRSNQESETDAAVAVEKSSPVSLNIESNNADVQEEEEEMYFDYNSMEWKTRPLSGAVDGESETLTENQVVKAEAETDNLEDEFQLFFEGLKEEVRLSGEDIEVTEADAREFFDQARTEESMQELEAMTAAENDNADIDPKEFQRFYDGLKEQVKESNENTTVTEKDARELFLMMKKNYEEGGEDAFSGIESLDLGAGQTKSKQPTAEPADDSEYEGFLDMLKDEARAVGADPNVDESEARELFEMIKKNSPKDEKPASPLTAEPVGSKFEDFYKTLKHEAKAAGRDPNDIDEGKARELYGMFNSDFSSEPVNGKPFADSDEDLVPADELQTWIDEQGLIASERKDDSKFEVFYENLKQEAKEGGAEESIDKEEAREFFNMFKGDIDDVDEESDADTNVVNTVESTNKKTAADFEDMFEQLKEEWGSETFDTVDGPLDEPAETEQGKTFSQESMSGTVTQFDDHLGPQSRSISETFGPEVSIKTAEIVSERLDEQQVLVADADIDAAVSSTSAATGDAALESALQTPSMDPSVLSGQERFAAMDRDLAEALPGMPASRIKKIRNTFVKTLGDPSMLRLVPLLRENMPDYVTPGWLKKKNLQNAMFCMKMARKAGLLDVHLMNGMLQVETSCGGLDRALQFHEEQFERHNVKHTPYSDRLVLQMLVKSNRLPRALQFKQRVEQAGRNVDIQSYGSIMEHYGNRGQLGSALLVLKECIQVHGAPPSEKYLKNIRMLCRRHEVEQEVGIEKLIGKDPVEWIRHGEANLKREMSYRGRRNINLVKNKLVHI